MRERTGLRAMSSLANPEFSAASGSIPTLRGPLPHASQGRKMSVIATSYPPMRPLLDKGRFSQSSTVARSLSGAVRWNGALPSCQVPCGEQNTFAAEKLA
jgi:hypothetical protein